MAYVVARNRNISETNEMHLTKKKLCLENDWAIIMIVYTQNDVNYSNSNLNLDLLFGTGKKDTM